MELSRLLKSFRYALRGVVRTAREERSFRIHLTAVCYVTWAGFLAELDGPSWTAVLLCCGAVLAAELGNTALEHICDAACPAQNPRIAAAKDAAAGAVLVLAIGSVGVAAAVFGPWICRGGLWKQLWSPIAFFLSLPAAILWIRGKKN